MNSGHSEKGREFCIRTETCLVARAAAHTHRQEPPTLQSNLPLVKGSLVHQVGGVVGAGEGVVHGLVLDDHRAVVRNDVAVEVVDGRLVLEGGRRQLAWPWAPRIRMRVLGKADEDGSEKSPTQGSEGLPWTVELSLPVWV